MQVLNDFDFWNVTATTNDSLTKLYTRIVVGKVFLPCAISYVYIRFQTEEMQIVVPSPLFKACSVTYIKVV